MVWDCKAVQLGASATLDCRGVMGSRGLPHHSTCAPELPFGLSEVRYFTLSGWFWAVASLAGWECRTSGLDSVGGTEWVGGVTRVSTRSRDLTLSLQGREGDGCSVPSPRLRGWGQLLLHSSLLERG